MSQVTLYGFIRQAKEVPDFPEGKTYLVCILDPEGYVVTEELRQRHKDAENIFADQEVKAMLDKTYPGGWQGIFGAPSKENQGLKDAMAKFREKQESDQPDNLPAEAQGAPAEDDRPKSVYLKLYKPHDEAKAAKLAKEVMELLAKKRDFEASKKADADKWKNKIGAVEDALDELQEAYQLGAETDVECDVEYDAVDHRIKAYIRKDTGEKLSPHDYDPVLPVDKEAEPEQEAEQTEADLATDEQPAQAEETEGGDDTKTN